MKFIGKDFIIYDLETSGIDKVNDSILSLSAIRVKDGNIVDTIDTFIQFHDGVPEIITELTGITDDDVSDYNLPTVDEAIEMFTKFVEDLPIGGYNTLSFDNQWLAIRGFSFENRVVFDVYQMVQFYKPIDVNDLRLESFAPHLGIETSHNSMFDCHATLKLLNYFNETTEKFGPSFFTEISRRDDILIESVKSANNNLRFFEGSRVHIVEFDTCGVENAHKYYIESDLRGRIATMFTDNVSTFSDYQKSL